DNRQVDIVIAVTPRVIRAPAILPEDEVERPTGSQMSPTNNSLEAMIVQEEHDEMLAAARSAPNAARVQLPDAQAQAPEFVKASDNDTTAATTPMVNNDKTVSATPAVNNDKTAAATSPVVNTTTTSAGTSPETVALKKPE